MGSRWERVRRGTLDKRCGDDLSPFRRMITPQHDWGPVGIDPPETLKTLGPKLRAVAVSNADSLT